LARVAVELEIELVGALEVPVTLGPDLRAEAAQSLLEPLARARSVHRGMGAGQDGEVLAEREQAGAAAEEDLEARVEEVHDAEEAGVRHDGLRVLQMAAVGREVEVARIAERYRLRRVQVRRSGARHLVDEAGERG